MSSYITTKKVKIRTGPAKKYKQVGTLSKGAVISVCEVKGKWFKFKRKNKFYWCYSKNLKAATNYGKIAGSKALPLAKLVVKNRAKHESGAYQYKRGKINCSVFVSRVLQDAGLLPKNAVLYHTSKAHKKSSIGDCVHNRTKVKHYKWVKTNSRFKSLPAKYRKPGCVLVYASSIAIVGEDGYIYGCHSSGKTYKKLSMIRQKGKAYEYTSPVLVVGKGKIE